MRTEPAHYDSQSLPGRFLMGEPAAHDLIVRWIAQVLAFPGYRILREEWSDLHQETMRRLLASLREGRFDASADFRVYVQGIARNSAREQIARHMRELRRDGVAATMMPAEGIEESLVTDEIAERAVAGASDECRRLFRALFYEQRTYAEMAAELDVPLGTVKSRLFRCLEKARRRLGEARSLESGRHSRVTSVREPRLGRAREEEPG